LVWTVKWSLTVQNALSKIDEADKIITAVEQASKDPFRYTKRLVGKQLNSLRVGKYRVIMQLHRKIMLIYVVNVGNPSRVYD
jgi:mRNA-degrading endonuclease RelE of RelBE toxin-antitoxin system